MAESIMQRIQALSQERETLVAREGTHHATGEDQAKLHKIDHDIKDLWDLRRRELDGERVSLDNDYLDSYDRYTD